MILIFIPWKSSRIQLVDPLTRQRAYPPLVIGALRVRPLLHCLVFDIILGNQPVPMSAMQLGHLSETYVSNTFLLVFCIRQRHAVIGKRIFG
jgi:hypothetical protein